MDITRKIGITVAATAVALGLLGVSAPAQARDSSWGCGGPCIVETEPEAEAEAETVASE